MKRKYAAELFFLAAFCAALILSLFNTKWTKYNASPASPRSATHERSTQ